MPRTCRTCGRELDRFYDGPGCFHRPPCALAFCFACQVIHFQGACAADVMRANPDTFPPADIVRDRRRPAG